MSETNYDLKLIKDKYGEKMEQFCRKSFPTILEKPGELFKVMSDNFAFSKVLYDDIKESNLESKFVDYIYHFYNIENDTTITDKTPSELLSEAGYDLYECKTEKEIQEFKKYYEFSEKLCTFNDERLKICHVFFAVKKNVDEIKREDFPYPKRQDLYGTSVISIQFRRGLANILSIKNRYNDKVQNPDATFSNNLDNIIPGLTHAFEKYYKLNVCSKEEYFEIPNYVKADDGKLYKYNYSLDNIFLCPNNIVIDGGVKHEYAHERYVVMDYYMLDMKEKTIKTYLKKMHDCFPQTIGKIKKVEIEKHKEYKEVIINKDIVITLDNNNRIIGYKNDLVTKIGDGFMLNCKYIKNFEANNLETIKNCFLEFNRSLRNIKIPKVKKIGNLFIYFNDGIESLEAPNVKEVGDGFMRSAVKLTKLSLPRLSKIGDYFLYDNKIIKDIDVSSLPLDDYLLCDYLENYLNNEQKMMLKK